MTGSRTTASTPAARVAQEQARRALDRVTGLTADRALKILRFSPAEACEPVHRLVAKAVADIRRGSPGVAEADLVVTGGRVTDGEAITRVRRHANGRGSSARADPSLLLGAPQFRCPRACGLLAPVSACKNLRFSPWFLNFPFP